MASLTITIEFPDESKEDIYNTVSSYWRWQSSLINEDGEEVVNPISREQCIQNGLLEIVQNIYENRKSSEAQDLARDQAISIAKAVASRITIKGNQK